MAETADDRAMTRQTEWAYGRVDPAALLAGVLAVVVIPLLEPGSWGRINALIGVAVGLVLVAFYVTTPTWTETPLPARLVVIAVLGIVMWSTWAYPAQGWREVDCGDESLMQPDPAVSFVQSDPVVEYLDAQERQAQCDDKVGEAGTARAILPGFVTATLIGLLRQCGPWAWRRVKAIRARRN